MKMVEALIVVRKAKDITIIAVDRLTKISNSTTITTVSQQAMR